MTQKDESEIDRELEQYIAEAEKRTAETLTNLKASETALFCGKSLRASCSATKRSDYRRLTRRALLALLDKGYSNILVDYSTLYGYYAFEELIRQRKKHNFTLILVHRERAKSYWLHTKNRKLSRSRRRKSFHLMLQCDKRLVCLDDEQWVDLICFHVDTILSEKYPYRRTKASVIADKYKQDDFTLSDAERVMRWLASDDDEV